MPVINFDQNSGLKWLQGIGTGQKLVDQLLSAPTERARQGQLLESQRIANQLAQQKAEFQPRTLQQQLAAQAAQTQLREAQIPLTQAEAEKMRAQTQLLPTQMDIRALNAALQQRQQLGQKRGLPTRDIYALSRLLQSPTGEEAIAGDPAVAKGFLKAIGSAVTALGEPTSQKGLIPLPKSLQERLQISGVAPEGAVPVSPPQEAISITPERIKALQQVAGASAQKRITPTKILEQRAYGQIADQLMNQIAPKMPLISQFAGLAGKTKKGYDAAKASLGENSPAYVAWTNFTREQAPLLVNEIRRKLGGQATDSEQRIMANLVKPDYWNSNPQLAMDNFNALINASKAADIALGMTTAQTEVATRASGAPLTVPSFTTKADFEKWYKNLSATEQFQYQQRLKGQ